MCGDSGWSPCYPQGFGLRSWGIAEEPNERNIRKAGCLKNRGTSRAPYDLSKAAVPFLQVIKHRKSLQSGNTACAGSDSARSGLWRGGIITVCVRTHDRAVLHGPRAAIAAGLGVPPPPAHGVTYCFPQPARRRLRGPAPQSTRNLSNGGAAVATVSETWLG